MQRNSNYWADLLVFKSFLLPPTVTLIWLIGSLVAVIGIFDNARGGFVEKLFASVLALLVIRFICEFQVVLFKIHEELVKLNNNNI
jgi:hypothetical protein